MDSLLLALQLSLAAVFATAGVGKLLDLGAARASLQGFGVSESAAPLLAPLLVATELAIAVALIPVPTARWAAIAAAVLLLVFSVGIASAIRQGRRPDCNCFGNLHSAPAGRGTLARNLGLATVALFIAWRGPDVEVGTWVEARTAAELAAVGVALIALALAGLVWRLWSDNRKLKRALVRAREAARDSEETTEGLLVGTPAPDFELPGIHGGTRTLGSFREGGRPVLVVFVDPSCGPCHSIASHVARWQAALADRVGIAVISEGDLERTRAVWDGKGTDILIDADSRVTRRAYRVLTWPSAIAIGRDGKVAHELVYSQDMMEVLIRAMLEEEVPAEPRRPAARVVSLPDVS